jgi:hypothetical protein
MICVKEVLMAKKARKSKGRADKVKSSKKDI